jgi:glutamate 5-kinase
MQTVPIINENDSVSSSEIRFGDNDSLSAIVAGMGIIYLINSVHADHLFLLTDVDCLYSDNPRTNPNAQKVRVVKDISELRASINISSPGSSVGTGGMITKLIAAELATSAGCSMVISIGSAPQLIPMIIDEIEQMETAQAAGSLFEPTIGTHFLAKLNPQQDRYWWILNGLAPAGILYLDAGAVNAISRKDKGSLFAAGIKRVEGLFSAQQCVELVAWSEASIEEQGQESKTPSLSRSSSLGRGIVNYSSSEIQRIIGVKSKDIATVLGYVGTEFLIHRDNIAIANK